MLIKLLRGGDGTETGRGKEREEGRQNGKGRKERAGSGNEGVSEETERGTGGSKLRQMNSKARGLQ